MHARALEARAAESGHEERELVEEIRAAGYDVLSVYDLVNNTRHPVLERRFLGPNPEAYPALLKHLARPYSRPVREGIIRALTVPAGGSEVEDALLSEFNRERDPLLRWVLANALMTVMPQETRRGYPAIAVTFKAGLGSGEQAV